MKKKVLFIFYNFPPFYRASSLRTFGWFESISDEFDVTVVTRKWHKSISYNNNNYFIEDEGETELEIISNSKRIYKVPNKYNLYFKLKSIVSKNRLIRRGFTFFELLIGWNFVSFDNERGLYYKAKELLRDNKFDYIVTSGEPFVLFKYASFLKKEFKTPIILDYRDGWTTDYFRVLDQSIFQKITILNERKFEKRFQKEADFLTFVSDQLKKDVQKETNFPNEKSIIINNGINEKDLKRDKLDDTNSMINKSYFNIVFIGTLYNGHRIDFLLNSLEKLINLNFKIKVTFVGSLANVPLDIKNQILVFKTKFENNIQLINYIDNETSLKLQCSSDLLLKFNAFEQKPGHFGRKMYEYAISGRKVVAINKQPNFNNFLDFFDEYPFIYYCNNSREISQVIEKFYSLWLNGEELENEINLEYLKQYTIERQIKKLENIILK